MSKKFILTAYLAIILMGLYSQRPAMELTFTAIDNTTYVQLDSIKIMNITLGCDTVMFWPDTVLSVYYVGIPEIPEENNVFKVLGNYPNPADDHTSISIYVPEMDKVSIMVTDMLGRIIIKNELLLEKGKHTFRFSPGNGNLFIFFAGWRGQNSSINILKYGSSLAGKPSLEYIGREENIQQLKAEEAVQGFIFNPGNRLLCIGYANGLQSGIPDTPEENTSYTFQFATNIPCPGTPIVEYEGQVYNTIQVFSQCWMKENLNVGTMIEGTMEQSDNGTIEKYCSENEPDSCDKFGGLYQWGEMMQYTAQQGAQGICPQGWHLPTDEEWNLLEGAADSLYKIGNIIWNDFGYRGYDAGKNLKSISGWYMNGNGTDLLGFSGLPGGYRDGNGSFDYTSVYGHWWTSTESYSGHAWRRNLGFDYPQVYRSFFFEYFGFSVRCLQDY